MAVENESFEDTIVDVVNYAVLLYAYLHDQNTQAQSTPKFMVGVKPSDVVHTNGCCKHKPKFEEFINNPWSNSATDPSIIGRDA